jgi:signal recognition particle GTPase
MHNKMSSQRYKTQVINIYKSIVRQYKQATTDVHIILTAGMYYTDEAIIRAI